MGYMESKPKGSNSGESLAPYRMSPFGTHAPFRIRVWASGHASIYKDVRRPKQWTVYVLLCQDDIIYVGRTSRFDFRMMQHFSGCGAAVTKRYPPQMVIQKVLCQTPSESDKLERALTIEYARGGYTTYGWGWTASPCSAF